MLNGPIKDFTFAARLKARYPVDAVSSYTEPDATYSLVLGVRSKKYSSPAKRRIRPNALIVMDIEAVGIPCHMDRAGWRLALRCKYQRAQTSTAEASHVCGARLSVPVGSATANGT